MKIQNIAYYLVVFAFTTVLLGLGYYILVNTLFARSVLPNVWVQASDVSLLSQEEITQKIQNQALNNLPERFNLSFENEHLSLPTNELGLSVDTYALVNYGKGNDILKVLEEGFKILEGTKVDIEYNLDIPSLFKILKINQLDKKSQITDSVFKCISRSYPIESINSKTLAKDIIDSIKINSEFIFKLENYLSNNSEKEIYLGCLKYFNESESIQKHVIDKLNLGDLSLEDIFELHDVNGIPTWKIVDSQILSNKIDEYKLVADINSAEGNYEIINNQIYLYQNFIRGRSINKESTITSIYSWVNSKSLDSDPIIYIDVDPKVLSLGLPIMDFTQKIGEGKTRIELVRNGFDNVVIPYTVFGLDEINKTVVASGEEFSYIKAIQPQANGTTKSGRPIAPGICNSTTTLFRAVLETGLQVTDRSYHAFYVPSYEWGYPLNIVDAAYFTTPVVDFKFKNDLDYPILLKVSYEKDSEYQYNTLEIFSSSNAIKRDVELSNWKVWDKYSSTNFKGSFDRMVSANGQLLFKDNFYSHYL